MSKARTGIGDAFTTIGTTAVTIVGAVAVCAGILALGACGQSGTQGISPQFTGPYAATASCTAEIGDLTELYGLLHTNPDHLEGDELNRLTLDCLKRHGLADENLTLQEYAAILQDHDRYQNAFGQYSDPQSSPDYNTFYACTTAPVNTD